jgi:SAM-dependent methyltransferase
MNVLGQTLRQLENFVLSEKGLMGAGYLSFQHQGILQKGYPYIRSSHERFEQALPPIMDALPPEKDLSFLEVGCGIGTKCEIARLHGFASTGFDLEPQYVSLATRVFPECRFVESNALDFEYGGFDLIYYFTPIPDESVMYQLEKRILQSMSTGSVLCVNRLTDQMANIVMEHESVSELWTSRLRTLRVDGDGRLLALQKISDIAGPTFDSETV